MTTWTKKIKKNLKELPFKDSTETYFADGVEIVPSSTVRDLGVLFNENLDWDNHYNKVYIQVPNKFQGGF